MHGHPLPSECEIYLSYIMLALSDLPNTRVCHFVNCIHSLFCNSTTKPSLTKTIIASVPFYVAPFDLARSLRKKEKLLKLVV